MRSPPIACRRTEHFWLVKRSEIEAEKNLFTVSIQ